MWATLAKPSVLSSMRFLGGRLLPAALALLAPFPGTPLQRPRGPSGGALWVADLRCLYLSNPLGIDVRNPRLSWTLGPADRFTRQSAWQVLAASSLEILRENRGDLWDSGRVRSEQSKWIEYRGARLRSSQQVYWKVRAWNQDGQASEWSGPAFWTMGLLEPSDWRARWIGQRRPESMAEGSPLPSPWLRRTFQLSGKPARAVAYVNALGYYELYVNGRKVDDHVLSPAVTDYSKRTLYVTHEIARYLAAGKNVIALWLGRGWYVRGHPGVIHDGPLVRAQVEITMPDGSLTSILTDETWKVRRSPLSPLGRGTAFGDYGGERYEPALELPGWNDASVDDSAWEPAAVFDPPQVPAAAQMVEPNRIVETVPAVSVASYPQGGYVIDLGRNISGWLEIQLPAIPAGSTVKLEYSDQMEPDKPVPPSPFGPGGGARLGQNPAAARTAVQAKPAAPPPDAPRRGGNPTVFPFTFNQRDEIAGNGAPVTFCSRFNYHGFRYVRVLGLEQPPEVSGARGFLIRTAYSRAGEFDSSDDLLNRIYQMVTRTYEALTLGGYVVDCPTRERLGYGGDAGTSFETGMFNFSTGALYNNWLANWRDSQHESGSLPHTAPHYPDRGGGGPMWGGFVVTLPWQMYLQYGDTRVLETNYPMIAGWLGYLHSETQGGLLLDHSSYAMSMRAWNFLGDWLTPKGSIRNTSPDPTAAQLINSLHYLYQLQLASKIARVLGKSADAALYDSRARLTSVAIHARFFDAAESQYANGDSVLQALPLMTGVVPAPLRHAVMKKLERTILVRNQGHLDTGMHGTYFLMKFLWENGRSDLVYQMASKRSWPSWGYMLDNGATTAWESWTGQSHIHDTLISIGAWFIEGLAGIRSDGHSPGFRHFLIQPAAVGGLTRVNARYRSIHGDIASRWSISGGVLRMEVEVPAGTTAMVTVPGRGTVRTAARPVRRGGRDFLVSAGTHAFESAIGATSSGTEP